MKEALHALIREISSLQSQMAERKEYGSLREYAEFVSRLIVSFGDYLLSDRQTLTAQERAFYKEMRNSPLRRPPESTLLLEQAFH